MASIKLTPEGAALILNSSHSISNQLKYALIALEEGNPIPDDFNTDVIRSEYENVFTTLQNERSIIQESSFISYIINQVHENPNLDQWNFDFVLDVNADEVRELVFTSKADLVKRLTSSFSQNTLDELDFENAINEIPEDANHVEISIGLSVLLNGTEEGSLEYTNNNFDAEVEIYIACLEGDGVDLYLPEGSLSDIFKDLTFIKQENPKRSELLLADFGLLEIEDIDIALYNSNFLDVVKDFDVNLYYILSAYIDGAKNNCLNCLKSINKNPDRIQFINNYNEDRDVSRLQYYLENYIGYEYVLSIWNGERNYYEYVRDFNAYRTISSMMYQIQLSLNDLEFFSEKKIKNFKDVKKLNMYGSIEKGGFVLGFQLKNEKGEILLLEEKRNISADILYEVMKTIGNMQYSMDSCIEIFPPEEE